MTTEITEEDDWRRDLAMYTILLLFCLCLNMPILDRAEEIGLGESITLAMCHPMQSDKDCAVVFGLTRLNAILEEENKTMYGGIKNGRWSADWEGVNEGM